MEISSNVIMGIHCV
ncbi:unnamed protein product [Victoria cruziana]